jgi:hypothetical protein
MYNATTTTYPIEASSALLVSVIVVVVNVVRNVVAL